VRDGATGRLVRPHDSEALAAALIGVLDDPESANRMGRAARELLLEEFSYERMTSGTFDVYAELGLEGGLVGPG
jgi:glycogen(starch) synthase